jgi:hypothetical protein
MAYDPSKPVNGSPIVAAELRNQFAGLNSNISTLAVAVGDLPTSADVANAISTNSAGLPSAVPPPDFVISDPPTQAEVQVLADYILQLYNALNRS